MSKSNDIYLNLTLTSNTFLDSSGSSTQAKIRVYAVNYNVLRIMSGLAGLAYAN